MKQTRRRANAARLIWIRESPPITLTVALAMLICGGLGLVRVARAAAAAPSVPQATEKPAAAKPPYYEQYAALEGRRNVHRGAERSRAPSARWRSSRRRSWG